jgi:hypothetical protein
MDISGDSPSPAHRQRPMAGRTYIAATLLHAVARRAQRRHRRRCRRRRAPSRSGRRSRRSRSPVRTWHGRSTTAPIRRGRRVRAAGRGDGQPADVLPQRQPAVVDRPRAPVAAAGRVGSDPARQPHVVAPRPAGALDGRDPGPAAAQRGLHHETYGVSAKPFYRPPFGYINAHVRSAAAAIGYTAPTLWYGSLSDSSVLTSDQISGFGDQWFGAGGS